MKHQIGCVGHLKNDKYWGGRPTSSHSKDDFLRCWIDYQNYCPKKQRGGTETDLTDERVMVLDNLQFTWKLSNAEHWDEHPRAV